MLVYACERERTFWPVAQQPRAKVEILRNVSHVFAGEYFDLDMHRTLKWCQWCQFPEPTLECPSSWSDSRSWRGMFCANLRQCPPKYFCKMHTLQTKREIHIDEGMRIYQTYQMQTWYCSGFVWWLCLATSAVSSMLSMPPTQMMLCSVLSARPGNQSKKPCGMYFAPKLWEEEPCSATIRTWVWQQLSASQMRVDFLQFQFNPCKFT